MTVPRYSLWHRRCSGESVPCTKFVILSKRSASKDLRIFVTGAVGLVRRSFDSLRSLRMTDWNFCGFAQPIPPVRFPCGTAIAVPYIARQLPGRKNPTTFPGIMLSERPKRAEIFLPLWSMAVIMKMTAYACYYIFGGKLPWQLNMN